MQNTAAAAASPVSVLVRHSGGWNSVSTRSWETGVIWKGAWIFEVVDSGGFNFSHQATLKFRIGWVSRWLEEDESFYFSIIVAIAHSYTLYTFFFFFYTFHILNVRLISHMDFSLGRQEHLTRAECLAPRARGKNGGGKGCEGEKFRSGEDSGADLQINTSSVYTLTSSRCLHLHEFLVSSQLHFSISTIFPQKTINIVQFKVDHFFMWPWSITHSSHAKLKLFSSRVSIKIWQTSTISAMLTSSGGGPDDVDSPFIFWFYCALPATGSRRATACVIPAWGTLQGYGKIL